MVLGSVDCLRHWDVLVSRCRPVGCAREPVQAVEGFLMGADSRITAKKTVSGETPMHGEAVYCHSGESVATARQKTPPSSGL
jgi:hypothetical protein